MYVDVDNVEMKIVCMYVAGVPSKANNSSQYSSNRTSRSSTSTIFSSHVESLISRSWSLSSKAPNRSHGAARWSLRVCDFSSCSKSAVVRNLSKRVCRSVRSESARSSLICVSECAKGSTGPVPEWMIYDVAAFSRTTQEMEMRMETWIPRVCRML